ncbi:DMT family transporter [Paenibacillus thalictri]|uniref:DMT family transporter n=1 Tax=Paenibacillus thalictri TaxID=2527873 RepID=A0A4Q9DVN2_9BACL|nr:DMT family transporter [Paenibacillus thalictri]TBL81079.1 DMT family transporter [Paenibacillus thalictri]
MLQLSRTRTAVYLAFLVLVWGVNWPLSKYALHFTPPILFAGLRTLIGGLILIMLALPGYKKLNFQKTWPVYVISSVLNIILYYGLQTIGLGYLPAGLFSAIVFFQPVLLGFCSWLWLGEEMHAWKWLGLVAGFLGVGVISAGGFAGHLSSTGILLALGSAVSWALGTVYTKKMAARVDLIWNVALQLTIGGVFLLASGSLLERWPSIVWSGSFIWSLLFISVFVIALGWLVFFKLVGSGEASKVGAFTFLIPVIAIVCSVIFMGESVTFNLVAGFVLIIASIMLVNFKKAGASAGGAEKAAE